LEFGEVVFELGVEFEEEGLHLFADCGIHLAVPDLEGALEVRQQTQQQELILQYRDQHAQPYIPQIHYSFQRFSEEFVYEAGEFGEEVVEVCEEGGFEVVGGGVGRVEAFLEAVAAVDDFRILADYFSSLPKKFRITSRQS